MFFKKRQAAVKQFDLMIAGNRFVVASSLADSGDVYASPRNCSPQRASLMS